MGHTSNKQIIKPVSRKIANVSWFLIIFGRVAYVLCAHSMNPADYYSNHQRKRESH